MRYLLPIITLQLDFINTLNFGEILQGESDFIYSRSDICGLRQVGPRRGAGPGPGTLKNLGSTCTTAAVGSLPAAGPVQ